MKLYFLEDLRDLQRAGWKINIIGDVNADSGIALAVVQRPVDSTLMEA